MNPLVETSGEGGHQAENGGLSGFVGPGSPETADRYRLARSAAAATVAEAKKTMEKDFRLASRKFWQTVR